MRRICLLLLLLFWTGAAQARMPALPVLYVADPLDGLQPVAVFNPDTHRLMDPLTLYPESVAHFQQYLPLASELQLYRNGEIKNRLFSGPFHGPEASCRGTGVFEGRFLHTASALGPLLAFSADFPGPRQYPGDYPVSHFQGVARQLVVESLRKRGVAAAHLHQLQIRQIIPFTLENGASIQFAVTAALVASPLACPAHSLLLVIEKVGRRYVRRLEKYQTAGVCQSYDFVSSFATGPLIDKILLRGRTPTARWYEVWQHQAFGGYQQVYRGGESRCHAKKNEN
jgi:hypothetical protein